ncbi:MAG: YraN family protein [Desulfobacteraceae bacterium]|nr:MAG: YraN family protein [Desulfobacteraceae bacterium]
MTRERLQLGKLGEDLALKKLKSLGYQSFIRNYRCPLGEIDLIARDGDTLVFLEIKTRRGRTLEYAKEAVNERKRRKIAQTAQVFLKENGCEEIKSRFDVVAINLGQGRDEIEVIKNAFEIKG